MSITSTHPLYEKRSFQWALLRDVFEGEDAIKMKGEKYLPKASGSTREQYEAYKKRARWNNFTARSLDGRHGLIFRRKPVINCSDEFKNLGLLENIDRRGTNLYQFLSDSIYDCMKTCFGGYLVDIPRAEGVTTKAEAEKQGIRPYLRYYPAESIINWGYTVINGVEQLGFVVLQENVETFEEDEFSHTIKTQYRVLDVRGGKYRQRLFTENDDGEYIEESLDVVINGRSLSEIPFLTIPSKEPEKPMFYDLAVCNIGHYQKVADYENGVHLTTIPTGYVTGHKQNIGKNGEHEVIQLGHDAFLMFEESDATVGTLCFSGEGLTHSETAISQAMLDMEILGSRMLSSGKTNESADSAKIHRVGENAMLATFTRNVSEKISKAITIMAEWSGLQEKIEVNLCTDYDTQAFDPNALNALANLAEAGKLPMPYVFWNLKNGEYAPNDSDYHEYATLLQMEAEGFTPLEQLEYMQKKQNSSSGSVMSISTKSENRLNNNKEAEDNQ